MELNPPTNKSFFHGFNKRKYTVDDECNFPNVNYVSIDDSSHFYITFVYFSNPLSFNRNEYFASYMIMRVVNDFL